MKKFLPYILILTIIVQLFAPFSVGVNKKNLKVEQNKIEAADCEVISESFTNPTPLPNSTGATKPNEIVYSVKTTNCINKLLEADVLAYPGPSTPFTSSIQRISGDNFSLTFHTGEKTCEGGDCDDIRIKLKFLDDSGNIIKSKESSQHLSYKCNTSRCEDEWKLNSTTGTVLMAQSDCKITNVIFNPPTTSKTVRPNNTVLYINTSGCQEQFISGLTLYASGSTNTPVLSIPRSKISSDQMSFQLTTGEKSCTGGNCNIIVDFYVMNSVSGSYLFHYTSHKDDNSDRMLFLCKGANGECDDTLWNLGITSGTTQITSSTTDVYYFEITDKNGKVTESSKFVTLSECNTARDQFKNNDVSVSDCKKITVTQTSNGAPDNGIFPGCSLFDPDTYVGCIGVGMYHLFFRPTSFLFGLTGKILDFAVMYSTGDESYRSTFVVEGWQIIRDFCNMFFIFVLLYIAIGTILQINGVKTREMIVNVVIIGLLINFSLFATQVIIDASNILTRVFYNSDTIVTGSQKDENGKVVGETGDFGELKLSEAIVTKVNPARLFLEAKKVETIPVRGLDSSQNDTSSGGISGGSFIIIVILTTIINVVGIMAFLSSSLIFITRVIGLWLAMILAPIAFFSYIVPQLQDVKMIGWKKWWPDTLKLAFLAPIFMFFMYLVVKFMDNGLGVTDKAVQGGLINGGLSFVVAIMVPFIMVMVILMKAKDIAKDMSGEMGQAITNGIKKYGGMVAGAGIGVATGGLAMLGRQTIGRVATNLSQSNKFRDWAASNGRFGKLAAKTMSGVAGGSFDARGIKVMGNDLHSTGLKVGKNIKTGGFAKVRDDKIKKEEEFANKMLDTTDYGIAELTNGKMSASRADRIIEQVQKSGGNFGLDKNGNQLNASAFKAQLVGGKGLSAGTARKIADQLNASRRGDRADYLADSVFATKKIKANKIRKSAADIEKMRTNSTMLAELKKQMEHGTSSKKVHTEEKSQPTTPNTNSHQP